MLYSYNLGAKFYEVSSKYSQRIAFRYPEGIVYSYQQLNELSNQIAYELTQKKIRAGDVVAIFNDKSPVAYALMLACMKIGIIYTNLDPTSPWQRAKRILDTCVPKLIFFDAGADALLLECKTYFPEEYLIKLDSKEFLKSVSDHPLSNLVGTAYIHGGSPVYIMFTSGSTGFPKGAVMSHDNVLEFIQWGTGTFQVTAEDVFTNANPIYFDNSVFDFYISLFNGASLVPLKSDIVKNAKFLVKAINDSKCTIWFSVPSLLVYLLTTKSLTPQDFSSIKKISFGGEGFPKNKLRQLYNLFGDRITFYNVYGPTECTCICSSYVISNSDFENMNELAPLGLMAPNFTYRILPIEDNNPEFGELALIGPCVGLGYYNDLERTELSFIQNSMVHYTQRMYKTGDVVERMDNGFLFFRGRIDNQIKHMGYRIELEEVEAALSSLSFIDEVGVIYEKLNDELGQIKAFVSVSDSTKDSKFILDEIKRILPPYMIPRILKILEVLPKNANGKIDRKQLTQF